MSATSSVKPLLWLVAAAFFMQTLDATVVNTAIPAMARALGESPLRMQSVVIAYLLTIAILMPASGWLADRLGTRRVFLAAVLLFGLGSLTCALASTLAQLVASRVLQGIGGAMLMPVGRLAILRHVPRGDFLGAMSFVTIPGLVGPLVGPTLGGLLVEIASWHWIFLINLPVAALGAAASWRLMPDLRIAALPRFDWTGFALLAFAMASLSFALDGVAELGLHHGTIALLFIAGLLAMTSYWLHASRHPAPLFSPRLFRVNSFAIGLTGNLFNRLGTGAMPLLLPLMLQLQLGYSPFRAGLALVPVAAAGMLAKRLATGFIGRLGYRRVLITTSLSLGLLIAGFGLFAASTSVWLLSLWLALFGAVNSMSFTAMNTLALMDLNDRLASGGNSLLSVVMQLGMSFGVATGSALLAAFSAETGYAQGFPATFACIGVLAALPALLFWQLHPKPKTPA